MPAADPEATAEKLLLSLLTPAQRADYKAHRRFAVTGSRGRHYVIDAQGTVSNVYSESGGIRYCVVPVNSGIPYMIWLCQKLLIEADEERFLHTACMSPAYPRYAYDEIR
jgi:hypothetical protein